VNLSDSDEKKPPRPPERRKGKGGEVGDALRNIYDRTVNESIPPEMLDLLGKLD